VKMSYRIRVVQVDVTTIAVDLSQPVRMVIPGPYAKILGMQTGIGGKLDFTVVESDGTEEVYQHQLKRQAAELAKAEKDRNDLWTGSPQYGNAVILIWPVDYAGQIEHLDADGLTLLGQCGIHDKPHYILACAPSRVNLFGGLFG